MRFAKIFASWKEKGKKTQSKTGGKMRYIRKDFSALPEQLSLENVRKFCHISKRTARYYLQCGLIPCHIKKQKTHCYLITKEQLRIALLDFEKHPEKFAVPKYNATGDICKDKTTSFVVLDEQELKSKTPVKYYQERLEKLPDVMTTADVAIVTGYRTPTVNTWCNRNLLSFLDMPPRRLILKKNLLRFLLSDDYNNIAHKSAQHLADIRQIHECVQKSK